MHQAIHIGFVAYSATNFRIELPPEFHEQNIPVMSILAGIAFAALVFALGAQSTLEKNFNTYPFGPVDGRYYYSLVIILLSGVGFVSVMSGIASMYAKVTKRKHWLLDGFTILTFIISLGGFALTLVVLLIPHGQWAYAPVAALEIATIFAFGLVFRYVGKSGKIIASRTVTET